MSNRRPAERKTPFGDVWAKLGPKIVFYIREVENLPAIGLIKGGGDKVFVKCQLATQKYKSHLVDFKTGENSVEFKCFAYFDVGSSPSFDVIIQICQERKLTKNIKVWGEASVSVLKIPQENVQDQKIIVNYIKEPKKKKNGPQPNNEPCQLHLRIMHTQLQEINPDGYIRDLGADVHFYDQCRPNMRTGDLILYSEVGLLSVIPRLVGNSRWSRAGMILKLPNKYTEKEKFYVLEITRNFDEFHDAFREMSTPGINLFRLHERIYEFPGREIGWLPLATPLAEDSISSMLTYLFSLHRNNADAISALTPPPQSIIKFLEYFKVILPTEYFEIQSAELMIRALTRAGIVGLTNIGEIPTFPTVGDLVSLPIYTSGGPYVVRVLSSASSAIQWEESTLVEETQISD